MTPPMVEFDSGPGADGGMADGGPPGTDAGSPGTDAGPVTRPAAPGELALTVLDARFDYYNGFIVELALANGEGGAPAPLAETMFSLETEEGAIVAGAGGMPGISVAPGATLEVTVAFSVPDGYLPTRVHYTNDSRTTLVAIAGCAPGSDDGICRVGTLCAAGTCTAPCSPSQPAGACDDDGVCTNGYCEYPCSEAHPNGTCEGGLCIGGSCATDCQSINGSAPGCNECLANLPTTACAVPSSGCRYPTECSQCVGYQSDCQCAQSFACEGCEADVRAAVACVNEHCPACAAP